MRVPLIHTLIFLQEPSRQHAVVPAMAEEEARGRPVTGREIPSSSLINPTQTSEERGSRKRMKKRLFISDGKIEIRREISDKAEPTPILESVCVCVYTVSTNGCWYGNRAHVAAWNVAIYLFFLSYSFSKYMTLKNAFNMNSFLMVVAISVKSFGGEDIFDVNLLKKK